MSFGFPGAVNPGDGQTAWVVPARTDSGRMVIDGGLFVARTTGGGQSWQAFRGRLPQYNAYDIVPGHGLDASGDSLYFGSRLGTFYLSEDRGESWRCLGENFPPVYSLRYGMNAMPTIKVRRHLYRYFPVPENRESA